LFLLLYVPFNVTVWHQEGHLDCIKHLTRATLKDCFRVASAEPGLTIMTTKNWQLNKK